MAKTLTAAAAFTEVKKSGEKIKNDETAVVGTVSAGDVIRQGDLYMVAIGSLPNGQRTNQRQLAPGTSQGSRHVIEGDVEIYDADKTAVIDLVNAACPATRGKLVPRRDEPLIGPVFRTVERCQVTHPEHGWRVLPDGEVFAVIFQRQHAEEVRRVQD